MIQAYTTINGVNVRVKWCQMSAEKWFHISSQASGGRRPRLVIVAWWHFVALCCTSMMITNLLHLGSI